MAVSLHSLTVPVFLRALGQLAHLLDRAVDYADEQGIDHRTLLEARLIDDMHPLPYQVQRASDTAKGAVARLGQVKPLEIADEEQSFAELQERIAKTVAYMERVPPAEIDERGDDPVTLRTPNRTIRFDDGHSYALRFALPNFFFHVTTAYAILRANGVPIGKLDYLGEL